MPCYCPLATLNRLNCVNPPKWVKKFKRSVESRTKLVSNSPASLMDSFFPPPCPQVTQTPSPTAQRGTVDSAMSSCVKGQEESALQEHPSPRVEPFLSRGGQGWVAHPCPALPAEAGKAAQRPGQLQALLHLKPALKPPSCSCVCWGKSH